MTATLGSKPPEPPGPEDHLRGPSASRPVVLYADFECPRCALAWLRLTRADVNLGMRHFPIRSRHPRAWPAACASEAAGLQDQFWEFVTILFTEQGRLDDPHLWEAAKRVGCDVDRFESDRRSAAVEQKVDSDFTAAIRAGVATSPTLLAGGELIPGVPEGALCESLAAQPSP